MSPWLLSRRQDLLWLHGAALAGLLLLLLFRALPPLSAASYHPAHGAVLVLLLWGVLFDGTHVMGTYARSALARDATSRAGLPGPAALLLLLLGPALALVDARLFTPGPSVVGQAGLLFRGFLLTAYLWAFWHLVRQHYGFLVLYQRRAPARERPAFRWEQALLWLVATHPFLRYSLSPAYLRSGLPPLLPPSIVPALRVGLDVSSVLIAALLLLLIARLRPRLAPRHLLIAVVGALHAAVFAGLDNLLEITAALTIYHNLQYHRIVWRYERGLGRVPLGGLWRYLLAGVALGALWYGPRTLGVALCQSDLCRNALLGLGWGVAFHHYFVDGRIWRVRRAPALAQILDRPAAGGT